MVGEIEREMTEGGPSLVLRGQIVVHEWIDAVPARLGGRCEVGALDEGRGGAARQELCPGEWPAGDQASFRVLRRTRVRCRDPLRLAWLAEQRIREHAPALLPVTGKGVLDRLDVIEIHGGDQVQSIPDRRPAGEGDPIVAIVVQMSFPALDLRLETGV